MANQIRRAILVDDDELIRTILTRALEHSGFVVVSFCDGAPALAEGDFVAADVVITDLAMPTPGDRIIREVRRRGHDVPIIVVTGMLGDGGAGPLLESGATAVLNKPIRLEELAATIENVLLLPRQACAGD